MLLRDIENIDNEDFKAIVLLWLRVDLSIEQERRDIVDFLTEATMRDRSDLILDFVDVMKEEVPREQEMPYVAYILTHTLEEDVLDTIVQVLDPEYFDIITGLLTSANEDHIAIGIKNVKKIFEGVELDKMALEILHEQATKKGIIQLTSYLAGELDALNIEYAVVPEWMIPNTRSHAQLVSSLVLPQPVKWISTSVEEDAKYLVSCVEEDKDLDDVYTQLMTVLPNIPVRKREEDISSLINRNALLLLSLDPEMFRVLGPCLPMSGPYDLRRTSRDPCNLFGGCRVYTCHENENVDPDTNDDIVQNPVTSHSLAELEWFTGRCDNPECRLFIKKKCYALRLPLETGGWLGCYCSFFCIRVTVSGSSVTMTNLIDGFEGQYLANGIYDRAD